MIKKTIGNVLSTIEAYLIGMHKSIVNKSEFLIFFSFIMQLTLNYQLLLDEKRKKKKEGL